MITIKDVRAKFPQYADLSDDQLADALHRRYYADLSPDQFRAKIGMGQQDASPPTGVSPPPDAPTVIPDLTEPAMPTFEDRIAATMAPPAPGTMPGQKTPQGLSARLAATPAAMPEDPLIAAMRGAPVNVNGSPVAPQPPAAPDPFAGEGAAALLKRRGQEVAQGAGDVLASVWEGRGAMAGRALRTPQSQRGAADMAGNYEATIADINARLSEPDLDQETRAFLEQNLADLTQGLGRLRPIAAGQGMPAEMMGEFTQRADTIRKTIADTFGTPPADDSFWSSLVQGAGSMAAFLGTTIGGGAVAGPMGGVGMTATTGAASNAGQVYREAKNAGADDNTALDAAGWAYLIGSTEAIPIGRALRYLPSPLRDRLSGWMSRKAGEILLDAGEEGLQEFITQVSNNLIASGYYDPERVWTDGATDAALVGAILGGGVGAAGVALEGRPAGQDVTAPPRRDREAPPEPVAAAPRPEAPAPATMAPPPPDAAPVAPAPEAPAPSDRFEVLDEVENGPDGRSRPTGRKVRYDRETGTVSPMPEQAPAEAGGAPGGVDSAGGQPQAKGAPVVGQGAPPAAASAPGSEVPQAPSQIRNQPRNFEFIDAAGVAKIGTEPGVMQYKAGGDAEGVTDRLKGVTEWRPERAGVSIIYEYADGRRVIADGHQRLGLAKRLAGQGKAIQMPAMILRQADGVTPEEARVTAALKNIAEGSGTALDAAKVLRGTDKTPDQLGLPPSSAIVRDAMGMRNLSDQAFGMVVNGVASERDGGIVGRVVADKAAQANILALLGRMQKDRPITAFQAESVARQAAADTVTETQDSLFGPEADTQNLYLERAKIVEAASKMKREEQSAFKNVIANAERLQAAGNQLDAEGNQARLDSAAAVRDYLTRESNTKGAISEALTAAARALKGGATIAGATRQFLDAVERELGARGQKRPDGNQGGATPIPERQPEPEPQAVGGKGGEVDLPQGDQRDEGAADGDLFGGPAPDPQAQILAAMTGRKPKEPEAKPAAAPESDAAPAALPPADPFAPAQTGKTPDQVRAEAEAAVRAQQTKLRKPGGNTGDAGPLFSPDQDLFDPPKEAAKPKPKSPTDKLADEIRARQAAVEAMQAERRAILAYYTVDGDEAIDKANAFVDLAETPSGEALMARLIEAKTFAEKKAVADAFVLDEGKRTGVEHLVVLTESGIPLAITSGHKSGVSFPAAVWRAGSRGEVAYSVHNHPSSNGFSGSDLAILAIWPKHTLAIIGHNGDRHEVRATRDFDMVDDATLRDPMIRHKPLNVALTEAREGALWRINKHMLDKGEATAEGEARYHAAAWPFFHLVLERMGLIRYTDREKWLAQFEAHGFNFEDFYGQVSGAVADRLGRAGWIIPEGRDTGGNRPAGEGPAATPPRTDGAAGKPAPNGGEGDGKGRVPAQPVGPAKTGNDALDGALDDIFGDEDAAGTGNDLERGGRGGPAADGMGATDVSAGSGKPRRGNRKGGRADQAGDGQRPASGRLPGGDAAPVGTGGNPGADGTDGTDRQPATSGGRGGRGGGGGRRLPADTGRGADPAGNAPGATPGKLTPAQQLAAIRGIFKEDVIDFVAGTEKARPDTPEFKAWFGESKVVDADGEPLILWHGTARRLWEQDFDAFRGMVWASEGSFLPMDYAAMRANRIGADQAQERLIDLYMRVERPFDADLGLPKSVTVGDMLTAMIEQAQAQGRRLTESDFAELRNLTDIIQKARRREESGPHYSRHDFWYHPEDYFGRDGAQAIRAAFRITGFDGIKMLEGGEQTWGAFDPTQVKSPQNVGTFDPDDPVMYREDSADPIDPRKAEALESIFVGALDGVNVKAATDRDLFRSIILPLRDAGMTRDEVAELTPYLESFLANLRAGRVGLAPEPAPRAIEADDRAAVQAKADRIKPVAADEANIRATLPLLLPEQQDDVLKVERRFAKPDGHGMMITNGTGTGKTFSGGGVIKRFVQMGKGDILIIAPDATHGGWARTLDNLGVPSSKLADTKDAGEGVVYTTPENAGANAALASREWDLVVVDEAQKLSSNKDGSPTSTLNTLRAITHRPDELWRKSRMIHADDWAKHDEMKDGDPKTAMYRRLKEREDREIQAWAQKPRSKVLFLSATPFAYDKSIDYAEGYLFKYPEDGKVGRSNQDGRAIFMVQNFGYRIRYHKLTKPEHAVDSAVFEREFHEKLKREGVLSGRSLQVDVDYDRRFVTVSDAIGTEIDAILKTLSEGHNHTDAATKEGYRTLNNLMRSEFGYLARMQLLEAIKAKAAVADIKKHLAMGRKVVVFHDFNKGGGFNPFAPLRDMRMLDDANALKALADLTEKHPGWDTLDFTGYPPPALGLKAAFGKKAGVFSGLTKKDRDEQLAAFNTDKSGVDVLIVQADAGGAGVSMHDVTGTHQRVMINLGMPTKPTTTLQQEGRILRVGTKTDAAFRYYTIGTAWERTAFAQRIAERSGTVENLALGNEARAITEAFVDAYMDAEAFDPSDADGKGGKAKDRAGNVTTPWQKAVSYYFARAKMRGRRDQREGLDFYPTPEPLGLKMVEWAGIRANERVLEPSAGDGAIARFMPDDAAVTIVEPSDDLGSTALLRAPRANLAATTFEQHHISNKYHVVVMNPPFGSGGKTAMDHLAKAAKHLRAGGRIVALIPTGPSADKRFDAWWEGDDAKGLSLSAEVALPAVAFERAGTSVMTRVVIIDKPAEGQEVAPDTQRLNFTGARSINEFFDRLEQYDVRRRPDPVRDVVDEMEAEGQDATAPMPQPVQGPPLAAKADAFKLAQVKHAKTGADLFVATIRDKVEREEYSAILAVAKQHGGYYSSFRGNGAVPGFQFKSEADRQAFLDDMVKPTAGFAETAYHGSPHDHDRFSLDKIGTGEGAQAYGWGLYFASKRGVAEYYRETLSRNQKTLDVLIKGKTFWEWAWLRKANIDEDWFNTWVGETIASGFSESGIEAAERLADRADTLGLKQKAEAARKIAEMIRSGNVTATRRKPGRLYTVDVPDAHELMDWDIPLTEQPEAIKEAIRQIPSTPDESVWGQYTGEDFYNALVIDHMGDAAFMQNSAGRAGARDAAKRQASKELRAAGIPGHRFLDGGSRSAGEGTHNYVIYDDSRISILSKEQRQQVTPPQLVRDATFATGEIAKVMPALRAELDRLDLKRVRLARDAGANWQGMFHVTGDGALEIVIGASMDPMGTLHHEVIHALRTMNLFTPEEWRALELAAERGWVTKHDIAARYPDLLPHEQIEEAIAEEFSEALAARKSPKGSALVTAFNKIARLFRALRNVLNGAGYQTAEDIFGRILAGEISKRQAGNTGVRAAMVQRQEGADARFRRPQAVRPLSAQARAHRNTGMGGALFIPDRRVWEELTRATAPIWARLRNGAGGMSDGIDRARVYIQDRFLPVLRAQEAIERATGKRLPPEQRAYTAETTFSGKVGRHLFEVDEDFVKPIIRLIAASKGRLTAEAVGEWLYARHAIERNAKIASINPAMPDGGSGMTNAEAQQILADAAASPDAARLVEIGNLIDKLRERTLSLREDAGLITHDEASDWRKMYRHYVPLKGFAETDHAEAVLDITGIGKRFNVRGGESRRALGRESEAFNPLQAAFTQAQEVAIRAEKNRVGQSLFELAKDYPSKALWEVKKPVQKRYFNRSTGLVETRVEDPVSIILEPNEMAVKISGEEHRILFHDERLARAAGTVGADQMGQITRLLSMFSRFWSMTRTMLNPEFAVTNAFRDFQTAQYNIQAFGEGDKGAIAKAMIRDWRKALAGSWRAQGNRYDTEWAKHYREFQKAGAQVSFWTIEQPEVAKADLERRVALSSGTVAARALKRLTSPRALLSMRDNPVLAMVERTNIAVDNAIRLAAFVEARKRGWSVQDAAFLAKELTVNFNRRGEWSGNLNALYPFFNAAVQGGVRTAKALTSRRVMYAALASFAAGALNDLLNAWLSDEDDDGQLFYDKVPEYRNERNFHIVGWGTGQNPVAVPMPYGYNIFPYAGQNLGKVLRGVKTPGEAMGDVAAALFAAFSPISGGSDTTMVSPFFADPFIEMAENKDWTGSPIYPRYPETGVPDSGVAFAGASEAAKKIAALINAATGGDFREDGLISISPETLDHLSVFVTGSAGAFVGRTTDVLAKAFTGKFSEIEMRHIPFLRNTVSQVGPWVDRDLYYKHKAAIQDANADVKAYAAEGYAIDPRKQAVADLYDDLLKAEREMDGRGEFNQSKAGAAPRRSPEKVMKELNRKYLAIFGKVKP